MRLVALGIKGSKSFDLVVKATARMKDETLAATLAETGLTEEEQARILVMHGYTATEAEATVAMANNTVSTAANTAAQEANAVAGAADTAVDEVNTATTVADTTATIANTEATVANTAAQEANAVAGATSSATNAGGTRGSLIGLAGKGLLGKVGSLFAGFGTSMGATLGVAGIAIGAAVAIGSGIRSILDKQKEEAEAAIKKQAEDAKNALDTNFSNIRSFQQEMSEVEGQITSIREKILKINQTDKLTIADKSEIDRLATQNQLLEQRLKLLKSSITYEKQQAAASAKKVLESQTQEEFDYFYTQPVDKSPTKQSEKLSDYKTALETQISELQSFYDRYSDVLDYNSGAQNPGSLRAGDATPSALNNIANNIQLQQGAAITAIDKVQSIISSFLDDDGNIIKGYEDLYNVYNQYLNELRLLASPDDILETLESVGISNDVYNTLMNQAYTGNFDISKIDDSIIKQFTDKGISEETIEKIFNYKASQYNYLLSEIDKKYNKEATTYTNPSSYNFDKNSAFLKISSKFNPDATRQVWGEGGNMTTEKIPPEIQEKNRQIQNLLKQYAENNPIEFQFLLQYDTNFDKFNSYLDEEYAKTKNWSKAFSSAMSKTQTEIKGLDLTAQQEAAVSQTDAQINSKLKKYAEDNPVEFELLLSYDEDFTEFDKYIKQQISNGEDLDTAFTNATKHFSELAKKSKYEEENVGGSMFSNIFNDDGADSFYKKIEKYESSLKKLLDYYNKIASGDFKDSDFAALWKDFPALAGETKNLDSAILSLINTMNINVDADFAAQLEEMKSKGATEQDIAQFQAFHDKVLSASQALTDFAHNANVAISKLENTENAFKAVKSAIDEYNDQNSFSFSTLKSLLELDDEHISLLFNEQGALDLSTQKYKDYTKAQIASLKAAILTDSLNQVENIKTKAAALEYLASSAHNAATSELELADAQWREALIRAHNKDQEVGGDAFTKATQQAYKSYQQRISLIDAYEKSLDQISESTSSTKEASKQYKNQLEAEKHALESTKKALEDKRDALEKQKDGYEEALSSLKDLVSLTEEYIRKMKDDEREALEKQKSAYDEIVSKKKEALRLAREEKKVNDEIAEKQKAVAKDALSLSIANLDDSSAGKKSQKTAQDNLVKSNEELQNQLADKEYETRIAALEKEQEAQDKLYDDQIKKIDEYLKNTRKIYEDACAMIDSDTGTLYSNLWNNYVYPYTTQTRAEYNHMWNSAQTALQQYGSAHQGIFALMNNLQENIYKSDDAIKAVKDTISNYATQIDNVTTKINEVGDAADTTIKKVQAAIQAANNIPDIDAGKTWRFSFDGIDYWVDGHKSKYEAANEIINGYLYPKYGAFAVNNPYSNGGKKVPGKGANYSLAQLVHDTIRKYAGGTRNSSSLAITQENGLEAIFGKLSQGQYTMMPQGSQVFNAGMTDNLWKFSSDPQKFISDVIGKMSSFLSSSYGNFADSARGVTNKVTKYGGDVTLSSAPVYHIYGNVDKNTLSTMDKQERQRYELFKKQFMLEMLREKNNL